MLDQLRSAIESVEIGVDSRSLLAALKLRDQLEARICEAVGEFEATDLWDVEGRTSMTGWLKYAAGMTGGDAHRMVQTALRLRQFPVTKSAWDAGDLSGGQVATVLAGIRREHRELADDLYEARKASYVGGTRLSQSRATEILCDAVMHRLVIGPDSTILDYGRATRTISAAIWSALVVRDEGCRFPGCDRPAKWSEAHHVVWFSEGGTTDLANLVLLCSRHHHIVHRAGWHAKLKPDGVFEVTNPWGHVDTTLPPRALQLC